MSDTQSVEAMWEMLVSARPDLASAETPYSAWHFCDNQSDADELAQLVLAGVKRATAGALASYEAEGEPLPQVGDLAVITDWAGSAVCVIRTTSVAVVPFDEVSAEFAAIEGEGDGSLAYWREVHAAAFEREFAELGLSLTHDLPVVCEVFDVVFPVASPHAD